jgi:hypothetical protein
MLGRRVLHLSVHGSAAVNKEQKYVSVIHFGVHASPLTRRQQQADTLTGLENLKTTAKI